MPYPPPPAPGRPARPAARVAAGLLWAFAAALAVGAQFGDIYRSRVTWSRGDDERIVGFWQSHSILNGEEKLSSPAFGGVSVLVAVAVLAVASLLVFVTRRRWGAVIVGTLGAGMMLDEVVSYVTVGAVQTELRLGPGWWLIVGAAVVAIAGFVVALTERGAQWAGPQPMPTPHPPPQPSWPPHQTPTQGPPAPGFPPAPPTG